MMVQVPSAPTGAVPTTPRSQLAPWWRVRVAAGSAVPESTGVVDDDGESGVIAVAIGAAGGVAS